MEKKIREFRIKAKFAKTFVRIFAISIPSFFAFIWGGMALLFKKVLPNQNSSSKFYRDLPPLPSLEEIFKYALIVILISLVFSTLYTYFKYKSKIFEFYNSCIKINDNEYLLDNLSLIRRPTDEMISYGQDYIILEFLDGKKVKFDKAMPRYSELRRFLKKYLYERVDYSKLLSGAEF